jgi:hypothetical protein
VLLFFFDSRYFHNILCACTTINNILYIKIRQERDREKERKREIEKEKEEHTFQRLKH